MNSTIVNLHIPCPKCPSNVVLNARARRKRWALLHPDKVKEIQRVGINRRRKQRPLYFMLIAAKARAKLKGIPFDLCEADLEIPLLCPVLKIPLTSPSLDRFDNDKGYVKDNVRVISKRANRLKSDMSLAECKLLLNYLECQPSPNNT